MPEAPPPIPPADAPALRTEDFDYHLPEQLIAQAPARPRDAARLLVVRGDGFADRGVLDLPSLLDPGDVLVVNDTRVIPARLHGRRGAARVEIMLNRCDGGGVWQALVKNARRLRPGDVVEIEGAPGCNARVLAAPEGGAVMLDFGPDQAALAAALDARGIKRATVTLHVGAGTFLPLRDDDPRRHRIHSEWGEVSKDAAATINAARAAGRRVVAIGTTAMRVTETAARESGMVAPFRGLTDLYILPGFRFRAIDGLLTNFHLPKSTLLMLVSAFAGTRRMRAAYAHAVANGYRFFSYGDGSLLFRCEQDRAEDAAP